MLTMRSTFFFLSLLCYANTIKVSVYYESLCPYSIRFITKQLYPSYYDFSSHLDIDFVPYGKANQTFTGGSWQFECQHGSDECRGNRYQACVLNQNHTQTINVELINCIMDQEDPSTATSVYNCTSKIGVPYDPVQQCFGNEGGELLAQLGNKTKSAIDLYQTGVPTVIFEDSYNSTLHSLATSNFTEALCTADPQICAKDASGRTACSWVLVAFMLVAKLYNL